MCCYLKHVHADAITVSQVEVLLCTCLYNDNRILGIGLSSLLSVIVLSM